MSWYGLAKVLSGFFLAIALIVGGGFVAAQYLITQFTAPPPRPVFPNDKPEAKPKSAAPKPKAATSPSPSPSPSPSASPSPQTSASPGFRATVTLQDGLNLREEPNQEAARVGGVDYKESVIVLEESPDKEWQKVRLEGSNQEGWIKAGYTERSN